MTSTEDTKEAEREKEETSETSTTSDAESPCEFSEDLHKKCLEELLLPMNELDNTMLSLWLETDKQLQLAILVRAQFALTGVDSLLVNF